MFPISRRSMLPLFAGGFNPFQISSLQNAFEGQNIVADPGSGNVFYPDSKGAVAVADLYVGTGDPYPRPSTATVNGNTVVYHIGANTDLNVLFTNTASVNILKDASSFTIAGYLKSMGINSTNRLILFSFATASPPVNRWFAVVQALNTVNLKIWQRDDAGETVNIQGSNDLTAGTVYVYTFDNTAKQSKLYMNGNLSSTVTNALLASLNMTDLTLNNQVLFYNNQSNSLNWDGYMGNHYMFNAKLTLANINDMGNYLCGLYNLTWTDF